MSSNVINSMPFLRTSRDFPPDPEQLRIQINKAYLEIANSMNERVIGFYTNNQPSITGENYYINNRKQQTLRQVYTFTSTASINHNINVVDIMQFTSCYGNWTDGTNSYGLIFGSNGAIPNQISFYLTKTQIIFVLGAGAPALTSGRIVLTWLSQT